MQSPATRTRWSTTLNRWLRPSRLIPAPLRRSLTLKLTVAFLTVGLVGALLVAVFVRHRTQMAFDQFVNDRGQSSLVATLANYYQEHNGWEGVEQAVRPDPAEISNTPQRPPRYAVTTEDGQVVLGGGRYREGAVVAELERRHGVQLRSMGRRRQAHW